MTRAEGVIYCDGCGVEITWSPVIQGKREYCCEDCLNGLPCKCGERMELDDYRRKITNSDSTTPQVV